MAGQQVQQRGQESGDQPHTSLEDHERTFEAFLQLIKWSIISIVLLLIGMAVFLL